MKRRPSPSVVQRNADAIERIRMLKADHPFWGYRRIWAHLRYVDKMEVNKKRVYRLLKSLGLLATQTKHSVPRITIHSKPRPERPCQWWGIDMTKIMTNTGWAYLVVVLDWYTKQLVGYHCGVRATSGDWLRALEQGVKVRFPYGVRSHCLQLMSDNGSQPTSRRFIEACSLLGIEQAFTSYNNPKGNADTERMIRTIKEELLWLHEWKTPHDVSTAVGQWIDTYNGSYLHSALNYRTPNQMEQSYHQAANTSLNIAC